MVGVVVATHGGVADALRAAAEAMSGPIPRLLTVAMGAGEDPASLRISLESAVRSVDEGDGVLVLTDVLGGTPCNLGLGCGAPSAVEVLTGVNLPMLLHLGSIRDAGMPLAAAAVDLAAHAQRNITHASELLRRRHASSHPR